MSRLGKNNHGEAGIDTLRHNVERVEIALQSISPFPTEAEGWQQTYPVEESCEHRVHGEHVCPCHCTDMLSLWQ